MDLHQLFLGPYKEYSTIQISIEIIATVLGLMSVYYSTQRKIWVYPTGIVSTALYAYLFLKFGLTGDMLINIYYTGMSIYGWVIWSRNTTTEHQIEVLRTNAKEWWYSLIIFIISIILVTIIYYYKPILENHNTANLNYLDWANWLDIFVTGIFLIGMWLMARRKVENWIFWIIGDIICIPIMIYKGLGITSVQYLVFSILAIYGLLQWKKDFKQNKN